MKFSSETIFRLLLVKFAKSPVDTLKEIARRFLPMETVTPEVDRLRAITLETPLILQLETTNACNAACAFCAYPKMKREKGVMDHNLFKQIVDDYSTMGGGPVSLTPLVGDALLDPHLLDRLRILEEHPQVPQVTLTTNAIALDRYSDEQVRYILDSLDCIQVSMGGLDATTYRALFGIDKFDEVRMAVDRLLHLREEMSDPPHLNLAFRTNDWKFELRYKKQLQEYRRRGAFVSHLWTFANYAGLVQKDSDLNLEVSGGDMKKQHPCIYAAVHMAVCWDGRVTACGCVDFEGTELRIGQVGEESLGQIWSGKKRREILDSFDSGKLPPLCRNCSAYKPDSAIFSNPFCSEIESHRPLPPGFFQQFWGG